MDTRSVLIDAFGRIAEDVERTIEGLDPAALAHRPDPDANSIGWLVWHLTRVQDNHVAEIAGRDQAWITEGWADRFEMAPDPHDVGYGHTSAQVELVRPANADLLEGYHRSVHKRTREYLDTIDADELDRIIDYRWDPPVTVGVRLVSVIDDDMQHAGQAAYVRGLVERLD